MRDEQRYDQFRPPRCNVIFYETSGWMFWGNVGRLKQMRSLEQERCTILDFSETKPRIGVRRTRQSQSDGTSSPRILFDLKPELSGWALTTCVRQRRGERRGDYDAG